MESDHNFVSIEQSRRLNPPDDASSAIAAAAAAAAAASREDGASAPSASPAAAPHHHAGAPASAAVTTASVSVALAPAPTEASLLLPAAARGSEAGAVMQPTHGSAPIAAAGRGQPAAAAPRSVAISGGGGGGRLVRRWRKWPARNVVLCDGRVMLGSTPLGFVMTCAMIFPAFGVHLYYIVTWFHPAVTALAVAVFGCTVYPLFCCALTEPGIVPRNTSGIVPPALEGESGSDETGAKLRFCETCQIWRGRRVKHCRTCDACIEAFDHHCPWMGNCVGQRNYTHFVRFVGAVNALSALLFALALVQLLQYAKSDANNGAGDGDAFGDQFQRAIKHFPLVFAQMIYTIFVFLTVIGLLHYHCDLVCDAQTTNEKIKGKWRGARNPYDRGCWANWSALCCGPTLPSRVPDLREFVDE